MDIATLIETLRTRYSPPDVPPCPVCGARLKFCSRHHGEITYACDVDEHYSASKWIFNRTRDPDVIALLNVIQSVYAVEGIPYEGQALHDTIEELRDENVILKAERNLYRAALRDVAFTVCQSKDEFVVSNDHIRCTLCHQTGRTTEDVQHTCGLKALNLQSVLDSE